MLKINNYISHLQLSLNMLPNSHVYTNFLPWKYDNYQQKQELCAFALKGDHNVYSLVPNIPVRNFFFKTFLQNGRQRPLWMSVIHF